MYDVTYEMHMHMHCRYEMHMHMHCRVGVGRRSFVSYSVSLE